MSIRYLVVDYEKAFDSVDIWAVLNVLSNSRFDERYTTLLEYIYKNATSQIMLEEKTNKIKIEREIRQDDSISPKVFTLTLEDMFKSLKWENKGILMDGERLNHLKFADDVTLITNSKEELQEMLMELNNKSQEIRLKINFTKTKYLNNESEDNSQELFIEGERIGKVQTFIYLGQIIEISKNNLKADLDRRIYGVIGCFVIVHINNNTDYRVNFYFVN